MNVTPLEKLNACSEAVEWARAQPSRQVAWDKCERGDWMLWILDRTCKLNSPTHRKLVVTTCACARLSLKYVTKGERRPLIAIQTAERWARGLATIQEVRMAAYAANAVAAGGGAAAAAAYAAVDADAAYAAVAAVVAADAYAAVDADAWVVRKNTLKRCAIIVRKYFSKPPKG